MGQVKIFTDGSAVPNPGAGGWCAIVRSEGGAEQVLSGGATYATSYEMEFAPAVAALLLLKEPSSIELTLDNEIVVNGINNGVKDSEKPYLWDAYLAVAKRHKVTAKWLKRNSIEELKQCDKIAREIAKKIAEEVAEKLKNKG
ncbi:MAG: ribonuclease HI [Helicobacteraceae bacterium]|jgi:ribonuclease HI|nr:ribonuclease HI [Helicobacteraceae bacterium]